MLDLLEIIDGICRLLGVKNSDAKAKAELEHPFLTLFSNSIIAAGLSCIGLLIYPHHIISDKNLFFVAICIGSIIFGYWTRDTNEPKIIFNRFWYGFSFALVFGLMRCLLFLYE